MNTKVSKILGCIYGVVVGDMIGSCYEGEWQPNLDVDQWELKPEARYTDDSEMTLNIVHSIVLKNGKIDAKNVAMTCAKNAHPMRRYGPNTLRILEYIRDHEFEKPNAYKNYYKEYYNQGSWGNGGLMRIAPVSLWCYYKNQTHNLRLYLLDVLCFTHAHPISVECCMMLACFHCALLQNPNISKQEIAEFVDKYIDKNNVPEFVNRIKPKFQTIKENFQKIQNLVNIDEIIRNYDEMGRTLVNDRLHSIDTFCIVLWTWLALDGIVAPQEMMLHIVNTGGDTDTNSSILGGILGCQYGMIWNLRHIRQIEHQKSIHKLLVHFIKNI